MMVGRNRDDGSTRTHLFDGAGLLIGTRQPVGQIGTLQCPQSAYFGFAHDSSYYGPQLVSATIGFALQ